MEGNGKSIHITGKKTDVSLDPVTGRLRISHSGVKWEWAADYEPGFCTAEGNRLHFSDALDVHLDYLLCDYLEHGPENPDMLTREITELLEPLPDSYKLFIRDTVRSLVQNFPVPTESKKQP